ncbi:MAG TPA: hypothetical protein DCR24_07935 [Bacillus bacterium]|nr:hypothetical protein [Bacillus sp. (in: firmicutes)]
MFDPTAFENIKVVIEGEIYDRDLSGEIVVIDRNDWINTAKLSREYEISFSLPAVGPSGLYATMTLEAGIENLSAELLNKDTAQHLAGCMVNIHFSMLHRNDSSVFMAIQKVLEDIWGMDRAINQIAHITPLANSPEVNNISTIAFNRLVYEDQIDDLAEMINYMITSLEKLSVSVSK